MAAWLRSCRRGRPVRSRKKIQTFRVRFFWHYQDAVLDGSGWSPVKHPSRVVLHLSLLEVEILCLVVCDAHLHPLPVRALRGSLIRRPLKKCGKPRHQDLWEQNPNISNILEIAEVSQFKSVPLWLGFLHTLALH